MSEKRKCPCLHDPTKNCPCSASAYNFVPVNSYDIISWRKLNDLILVKRIDKRSLRIQPNIEFSGDFPEVNQYGYNAAIEMDTTASKKILYIAFNVFEKNGKLLLQAVTPE